MSTLQGRHLVRVRAAYLHERTAAKDVSTIRLRWRRRKLRRRQDDMDPLGGARLKAVTEELTERGVLA